MNKFEQALQEHINQLPREKAPERDLWTGIDVALTKEMQNQQESDHLVVANSAASAVPPDSNNVTRLLKPTTSWFALAASVMLVAVTVWLGRGELFVPNNSDVPPALASEQLVTALFEQHELQKRELLAQFAGQQALTENWSEQLAELDDASAAIRVALQNDPNNMALLKMLQHVHQQQISLIETVYQPKWQQI